MYGKSLEAVSINAPSNCNLDNYFQFQLQLVLTIREGNGEGWKNFIEKCSTVLPHSTRYMYEYKSKSIKNEIDLNNYFLVQNVPRSIADKVLKIYKKKYESPKMEKFKELVSSYNILVEDYDKNRSKVDNYYFHLSKVKSIDIEGHSFIKYLTESIIALRVRNKGWLSKSLERLISIDNYQIAFEIQKHFLTSVEKERFYKNIVLGLKRLKDGGADKSLLQLLVTNLSHVIKNEDFRTSISEFRALWSSSNLEKIIDEKYFGSKFPTVWLRELEILDMKNNEVPYLRKISKNSNVRFWSLDSYHVFKIFFPDNKEVEKLVISNLRKMYRSKNRSHQFTVIDLLDNITIKKALSEKDKFFKKPLFSIKRRFYNDLLNNAEAVDLSIYNLILLGEEREEFLWWLLL